MGVEIQTTKKGQMKKLMLIFLLYSGVSVAQMADTLKPKPIQTITIKPPPKKGKGFLVLSGGAFLLGAAINYNNYNMQEPSPLSYATISQYNDAIKSYEHSKNSSGKLSSIFYGVAACAFILGVSLAF